MKSKTTKGMICLDGPYGLVYQIGIIAYTVFEDESFRYEFIPKWEVIDLLELPDFQGVPGFDLDVRKDVYVRENITPTFISERAPAEIVKVSGSFSMTWEWIILTRLNG